MKYLFLTIISIILSCHPSKFSKGYYKEIKSIYINDFKLIYFKKLLIRGYNNSKEINNILNSDHSGFTEHTLSLDDYNLIDSLTKIDNEIIVKDSLQIIGKVAEGAKGKRVLSFALDKYNSKWLDSLAKIRWKISKTSL
jgi:hypothetical protein